MKKLVATITAMAAGAALTLVAADAKALYEKGCAKCHGADGKGKTKMGEKMKAKDYSDAKVQEAITDDAIAKAIKEGYKDKEGKVVMKPSPNMTDEEVKALVKHMRSFKK